MEKKISIKIKENPARKKELPELSYKQEVENINNLYLNNDCQHKHIIIEELKYKLNGYKQQDVKKNRYNKDLFITIDDTIEKLVSSKMICHYCQLRMKLLYNTTREPSQWTLDREDNSIGHNNNNLVICCLNCNLKRRKTEKDKFLFTKKMKLIKLDS